MRHEFEPSPCERHPEAHLGYFLLGAMAGAAVMFLFDPLGGRRRRKLLTEKLGSSFRHTRHNLVGYGTHLGLHAKGAAHELRAWATEGPIPDHQLVERVRSQLGRGVHHVRHICVSAHDGVVTLSGCALREEANAMLANVERVRGVKGVECQLHLYNTVQEFPATQSKAGGSSATGAAPGSATSRQTPSVPSTSAGL